MIARTSSLPVARYPQARLISLPFPATPYKSPSVMSPHGWNIQKVAEQGANLEPKDQPFVWMTSCDHCAIGIGPGHVEHDLYCYFLTNRENVLCMINGSEKCISVGPEGQYFFCCGGCARYRTRRLPESCCLFTSEMWTTDNLLLQHAERSSPLTTMLKEALRRYRALFLTWITFPFCLRYSLPLASIFCLARVRQSDKKSPQLPVRSSLAVSGFMPRPQAQPVSIFS